MPNKVTRELKGMAQEYTAEAIATLVSIMSDGEAPAVARVAAAGELLDRAHGKAAQTIKGDGEDGNITVVIQRFGSGNANTTGEIRKPEDQA